jgi:hypothetical protein
METISGKKLNDLQNSAQNLVSPFLIRSSAPVFGEPIAQLLRFFKTAHGGICTSHWAWKFLIFQFNFARQSAVLHRQLENLICR